MESREMPLEEALEKIKQINDRHELQLRLAEAARQERANKAGAFYQRSGKRNGGIWR